MKIFFIQLFSFFILGTTSCSDDISNIYSHKYRVMCGFQVVSYAELQHVVGNNGQYSSVRLVGDKIEMKSQISTTKYNLDALSKDFQFGCAGLIIGTTQMGDLRAYDLACPNCDRSDRRLTLRDDGTAICPKCEIEYDLNYDGVITPTVATVPIATPAVSTATLSPTMD